MAYRELLPHPALRPFVDRLWLRAPDAAHQGRNAAPPAALAARILPDGCIDILVDVASGEGRVVGTMTRAAVFAVDGAQSLAAVRFKPGAASGFLRVPASELTDRVVPATELGSRWLLERRAGPGEPCVVLGELERQLLARLGAVPVLPLAAREGARRLFAPRAPSVEELARELGQSRQQLARTFRRELGVSPKELARIARLQRAIDRLQRLPQLPLAAAALDLGYYDQAHMARDLRALAGITARQAQRSLGSIFPIRSLWLEP